MKYYGNVYRPPTEADSLVIQATIGCSYNKCTFCKMYKDKKFVIRKVEEVLADLKESVERFPYWKRVFIADGDALVLPTDYLVTLLDFISEHYNYVECVSVYATARDVNRKSDEDLKLLSEKGLNILYIGFESGSDEVLKKVNKIETREDYIKAIDKAKRANMETVVSLMVGIGGQELSNEHALESAGLITITKPSVAYFLTTNIYEDTELYRMCEDGKFTPLLPRQGLEELKLFVETVDAEGTFFMTTHAFNYVPIECMLNSGKQEIIRMLDEEIKKDEIIANIDRYKFLS